jgi:hypothetical protein
MLPIDPTQQEQDAIQIAEAMKERPRWCVVYLDFQRKLCYGYFKLYNYYGGYKEVHFFKEKAFVLGLFQDGIKVEQATYFQLTEKENFIEKCGYLNPEFITDGDFRQAESAIVVNSDYIDPGAL